MPERTRVLLAKLGFDAHTIGVTVVARALRDAGMEVIYSGLKQTPEMVVQTAIQESVDIIGVSCLSGAHMRHLPRLVEILRERGVRDKLLIAGGVIPEEEAAELVHAGIDRVFTMGTKTSAIVAYIQEQVAARDTGSGW